MSTQVLSCKSYGVILVDVILRQYESATTKWQQVLRRVSLPHWQRLLVVSNRLVASDHEDFRTPLLLESQVFWTVLHVKLPV